MSDNITINLFLTERCNFECAHCGYSAGPSLPAKYMSDEVLDRAKDIGDFLSRDDFNVSYNLIGGEPTLNLREFERVVSVVKYWNYQLEMTTNGWWLHHPRTTKRFLEIIFPLVDPGGLAQDGISVRISNDQYHDLFRPDHLVGKFAIANAIERIWDNDEYWPKAPKPHPGNPWLYAEGHSRGDEHVVAAGRGYYVGSNIECHRAYALGFAPDGTLKDICCRFSNAKFGSIWEDPEVLLERVDRFIDEIHPSCDACSELMEKWYENQLVVA